MKKEKEYGQWFPAEVIRQAASAFNGLTEKAPKGKLSCTYRVSTPEESWSYDTEDDFFGAYGPGIRDAKFTRKMGVYNLYLSYSRELGATKVAVGSPSREEIEDIFAIFEAGAG
jgi:hypothetical protein